MTNFPYKVYPHRCTCSSFNPPPPPPPPQSLFLPDFHSRILIKDMDISGNIHLFFLLQFDSWLYRSKNGCWSRRWSIRSIDKFVVCLLHLYLDRIMYTEWGTQCLATPKVTLCIGDDQSENLLLQSLIVRQIKYNHCLDILF